jgi:hypothetical protein
MSFEFIPRKLQQRAIKQSSKTTKRDVSETKLEPTEVTQIAKGKHKVSLETSSEETILALLRLAFSDYTLYKNDGFRHLLLDMREDDCS